MEYVNSFEQLVDSAFTSSLNDNRLISEDIERALSTLASSKHVYRNVSISDTVNSTLQYLNDFSVSHGCRETKVYTVTGMNGFGKLSRYWTGFAVGGNCVLLACKEYAARVFNFVKETENTMRVESHSVPYEKGMHDLESFDTGTHDIHFKILCQPDMIGYATCLLKDIDAEFNKDKIKPLVAHAMRKVFYLNSQKYLDLMLDNWDTMPLGKALGAMGKRAFVDVKFNKDEGVKRLGKLLGYPDCNMVVGVSPVMFTDRRCIPKQAFVNILNDIDAEFKQYALMYDPAKERLTEDLLNNELRVFTVSSLMGVSIYTEAFVNRIKRHLLKLEQLIETEDK